MSRSYIHSLVWLALFAAGQTLLAQTTNRPPIALAAVKTWAYQLQDLTTARSVDALAESHYDLLVVEPSRTDWSSPENRRFDTPRMVRRLQVAPTGDGSHRRLVLAYLNVGEAEGWRWYWTWPQGWTKGRPRPPGFSPPGRPSRARRIPRGRIFYWRARGHRRHRTVRTAA